MSRAYSRRKALAHKAKCSRMGKRSQEVQAAARLLREPDFETQRARALHDRRGQVVREGCTYTAKGETHWKVRHAVGGRTDQFEIVANGRVFKCCGPRRLPVRFRPQAVD